MDEILGPGNTIFGYLIILLVYGGLFVAMRQAAPRIHQSFVRSFWVLYVVWAVGVFASNYLFYLLGIMSFLPWLNNGIHSFIWIGLCLGFLYAISYERPLWQQLVLFTIYSLAVKFAENKVLGTWEFDRFFVIEGNLAYIIGWSLVDGLYPVACVIVLRIASRFIPGLVEPKLNLN